MNKVVLAGAWDSITDPIVQLMDVHSRGWDSCQMKKMAAVMTKEISEIRPEPGHSFIHLLALGDTESTGPNRNGDGFSRENNIANHHHFVKTAHVYKNHDNKPESPIFGEVAASAHNDAMGRVELVVKLPDRLWGDELQKLACGEDIPWSMACRLPFDVCSICQNKAPSRKQYCKHASDMLGQILNDGRLVYVDNPDSTFFDISKVFRPADRTAYNLQKVAGAGVMSGAELAEMYNIGRQLAVGPHSVQYWKKMATLRKLSEMEKEIEAIASGSDPKNIASLGSSFSPDVAAPGTTPAEEQQITQSIDSALPKLMACLGDARISLPVKDFIRLLLGNAEVNTADVESRLPGIFSRMLESPDEACAEGDYDCGPCGTMPTWMKSIVDKMVPGLSLREGPASGRMVMVIAGGGKKPRLLDPQTIQRVKLSSASDMPAELVAREYAKYKLALLTKAAESEFEMKLGVLQHYVGK